MLIMIVERAAEVRWVPMFSVTICRMKIAASNIRGGNSPGRSRIRTPWLVDQAMIATNATRKRSAASANGGRPCSPILIETELPPHRSASSNTKTMTLECGCSLAISGFFMLVWIVSYFGLLGRQIFDCFCHVLLAALLIRQLPGAIRTACTAVKMSRRLKEGFYVFPALCVDY